MCLNTDAPRMRLLLLLFAEGLGSHVGRKWRHPASITVVVFQASSRLEDVCLFMKTVSDPFWGFSYLCFSWLFPWSWYLSAQLPRWAWPCLPSARCVAFWGTEHPQSSLCHCPQVWHFSQSLKGISNLGAAGYESTQVGFSQASSPSSVPFVSFIYLKNKTADS